MKSNQSITLTGRMLPIIAVAALLLAFGTTGCNTIHGVGRDVEYAGERIERAAR